MEEDIQFVVESAAEAMQASVKHLEKELISIRAGKANAIMLQGVMAEYYGANTPIQQLASIIAEDGRTLKVQPFDKGALASIERGIIAANLGLNPQNDGNIIRIHIPQLTEERRKTLVKQAGAEGEKAKVSIRNVRRDHNNQLKDLQKDGFSEDQIKRAEEEIQKHTNSYSSAVDEILKKKESEILTI